METPVTDPSVGEKHPKWGMRICYDHPIFGVYMDEFLADLKSGEAGWGVSFLKWLMLKRGWELMVSGMFRRGETIQEELQFRHLKKKKMYRRRSAARPK